MTEKQCRVGGDKAYVFMGDDVMPSTAGGAFTGTVRVVNKIPNPNADYGFDTANYGLFIDVSGGTQNYGLLSNASLLAPAYINTKVGFITFSGTGYSIDLTKYNMFVCYATKNLNIILPSEDDVKKMFGYNTLPDGFGTCFTFNMRPGSNRLFFPNVYGQNGVVVTAEVAAGDSITFLAYKYGTEFLYQVLNYNI